MATNQNKTLDILQNYMSVEVKYDPAPVPPRVDRDTTIDFIRKALADDKHEPAELLENTWQLVLLAVFHDLGEAAGDFMKPLNRMEQQPHEYKRSAMLLFAVAWIGSQSEADEAWKYFEMHLTRADPYRTRPDMLRTCDAFGPTHDTRKLREWVQKELDRAKQTILKHESQGDTELAAHEQNRANELDEFLRFKVTEVDEANTIKERLLKAQPEAQTRTLVSLYLEDSTEFRMPLAFWSAMTLLRNARASGKVRDQIAGEFADRAALYDKQDPNKQTELDAMRAKCLRAADFFGHSLPQEEIDWLAEQPDEGVEELALRPKWQYGAETPQKP